LTGDTLFGQLCWFINLKLGTARLESLLEGYTQGQPFAILSDAFPRGCLPLPTWPGNLVAAPATGDKTENRKQIKARHWLPVGSLNKKPALWWETALGDEAAFTPVGKEESITGQETRYQPIIRSQPHNSLNRLTGTTGEGFDPYTQAQTWYHPATLLDLYTLLEEDRLGENEFLQLLGEIGVAGYGRDASQGLGKFEMPGHPEPPTWNQTPATRFLTLAPCAPQGQNYDPESSFYQVKTHFGRHGQTGALSPNPFKHPLLMAKTGAVISLREKDARLWLGQGLAGISPTEARAVHQGYAPVVPLPDWFEPGDRNEAES
jgi:CRISPR-associated protein Csm4